jgi:glucosamine 6-phosphate synthetase-like amidotransferase/phosphosugar isomerase protein
MLPDRELSHAGECAVDLAAKIAEIVAGQRTPVVMMAIMCLLELVVESARLESPDVQELRKALSKCTATVEQAALRAEAMSKTD